MSTASAFDDEDAYPYLDSLPLVEPEADAPDPDPAARYEADFVRFTADAVALTEQSRAHSAAHGKTGADGVLDHSTIGHAMCMELLTEALAKATLAGAASQALLAVVTGRQQRGPIAVPTSAWAMRAGRELLGMYLGPAEGMSAAERYWRRENVHMPYSTSLQWRTVPPPHAEDDQDGAQVSAGQPPTQELVAAGHPTGIVLSPQYFGSYWPDASF